MNKDEVIKLIRDAFAGVTLGDGVSLRQTRVFDDRGSDEEAERARANDELTDWTLIPDRDIEEYYDDLCFLDAAGARFHLPHRPAREQQPDMDGRPGVGEEGSRADGSPGRSDGDA